MTNQKLPHDHNKHTPEIIERLPDTEEFAAAAEAFRLMGDSTRVRLFWILCHYEECVIDLAAMMGMSSPALSHHLKLLKENGLIVNRREGREMFYRAADTQLAQALHHMIEDVVRITCPE